MSIQPIIIAIDGGSGTGKSSTARALADKLDFLHIDTGIHYRTLTLLLQQKGLSYNDTVEIPRALSTFHLDVKIEKNQAQMRVNHKAFDESLLRSVMVNAEVSYYSSMASVRQFLLHFQRSHAEVALMAGFKGIVMEGRDIGLNIFPETPYKYYFTADPSVKKQRRAREGIADVVEKRDLIDSTTGQMRPSPTAVVVDTSAKTLEQVVDDLFKEITLRLAKSQ